MPHGERPRAAEQAPRPARVLSLELVGGAGAILDAARRAVGVAPDGSLRNAIPGAHVERDGNIVRLVIPNPTRAMHFVPGRGLTDVRYSILDARGQVVASGEAAPKSGTLPEAFDRLAGAVPDATPSPSPVRLWPPLPTFPPLPAQTASASPAAAATALPLTAAPSLVPAGTLPSLQSPSLP